MTRLRLLVSAVFIFLFLNILSLSSVDARVVSTIGVLQPNPHQNRAPHIIPTHPLQAHKTAPPHKPNGHPMIAARNRVEPAGTSDGNLHNGGSSILQYNGGPVMHHPIVRLIFGGADWNNVTATASMKTAIINTFSDLADSAGASYRNLLSQYSDSTDYVHGDLTVTSWVDTNPTNGSFLFPWDSFGSFIPTWGSEYGEITQAETSTGWNNSSDTLWMIFPQPGANYSNLPSSSNNWCAFHGETFAGSQYFALDPYESDPAFSNFGCPQPIGLTDYMTTAASHEWAEAVTDPAGNAWYNTDSHPQEIGDLCNKEDVSVSGVAQELQRPWDNNGGQSTISDPYCASYSYAYWASGAPTVVAGVNSVQVTVPTLHTVIPATVVVIAFSGTTAENSVAGNTGYAPVNQSPTINVLGLPAGVAFTFQAYAVNMYGSTTTTDSSASATPTGSSTTYQSVVEANSPTAYFTLDDNPYIARSDVRSIITDSSNFGQDTNFKSSINQASTTLTPQQPGAAPNTGKSFAFNNTGFTGFADNQPSGNSSRTVELWEKTTSTSDADLISYGTHSSNNAFVLLLEGSGSELAMSAWSVGGVTVSTPYSLADGVWHQIDVSYTQSSNTFTFYVDGQRIATVGVSAYDTVVSGAGLAIGGGDNGNFNGSLDEVAIYPSALTPAQVNTNWMTGLASSCPSTPSSGYAGQVVTDGAVGYYRFGESSGRVAWDSSGSCWAGAYGPGISHVTGALVGDSDNALQAASSAGTAALIADNAWPSGNAARSVEIWEKQSGSVGGLVDLLSYGTHVDNQAAVLLLDSTGSSVVFSGWNSNSYSETLPYGIYDGTWHELVVTYDGADHMKFYLDGLVVAAIGTTNLNTVLSSAGQVGYGGNTAFPGTLDELSVYPTALTASRVGAHWLAAEGATCPSTPSSGYAGQVISDGASSYYRLGDAGRVAQDFSGNCLPGSYGSGVSHVSGAIVGDSNTAVHAASTPSSTVVLPDTNLPAGNSARTIEIWEKQSGATGSLDDLVSYGTPSDNEATVVLLDSTGSSVIFSGWSSNSYSETLPYGIYDGTWHELVITYDGADHMKFYLDGSLIATVGTTNLNTVLSGAGQVGYGANGAFPGALDELSIYPTALSSSQVSTQYSDAGY